jgi:hypothetical protein
MFIFKFLALFILAILSYQLKSYTQVSDRIVDTSKQWSMMSHLYAGVDLDINVCLYSWFIKFSGESTIDSISYFKVYKAEDSLAQKWTLVGYIRENDKNVYGRTLTDDQEYLMYDFNVEVNDTIHVADPFTSPRYLEFVVSDIDSVSLINCKKKRIKFSAEDGLEKYWIEGIGSTDGVIYRVMDFVGAGRALLCFHEKGTLQYTHPKYNKCFYLPQTLLKIKQVHLQNNISIYPNPASDYIYISVDRPLLNLNNLIFKLYNLNWQLVYKQKFKIEEEVGINLAHVSPGAYVYIIVADDKLYQINKLIKQ